MQLKTIYNILMVEKPSEYFLNLSDMKLKKEFPYLSVLKNVEQDLRHHPEGSVFNHTMMVIDLCAKLKDDAFCPFEFMLSALLHDIGKVYTRSVDNDGKVHFYHHDETGANMIDRLYFINNPSVKLYVKNMIYYHMRCNNFIRNNPTDRAFRRLFRKAYCPNDLILLAKADHLGRLGREDQTYEKELKYLFDKLETCQSPPRKITLEDNVVVDAPKNGYRYYKKKTDLDIHCIRSLDVANEGEEISLDTLEGVIRFKASDDIVIMIGPFNDNYITSNHQLENYYDVIDSDDDVNIKIVNDNLNIDSKHIKKCILKNNKYIYAKMMSNAFEVESKHGSIMKGKPFSYKAIDVLTNDTYIIDEYVFKNTYELIK